MHQFRNAHVVRCVALPSFTNPVYTFSFEIIDCPDGSTLSALLKRLDVSPDSSEINFIRGYEAVQINSDDVDFPLCDEDILHITDNFSLVKRFF